MPGNRFFVSSVEDTNPSLDIMKVTVSERLTRSSTTESLLEQFGYGLSSVAVLDRSRSRGWGSHHLSV
jgi:hypothetical protein